MDPLRPTREEALAGWARRVRENREQVDRFRGVEDGADFYAPVASMFRANPHRTDEPVLDVLRSLVQPDETWLDIGAGGGRYALPIALAAREVIALEPSDGMLAILREGMAEHGIDNVRIEQTRWPSPARVEADVALISHVGYDIEEIGPFLDVMEAAARRLCVAVLLFRQPTYPIDQLWPAVHGEARAMLPALPEFLALQLARGKQFEVRLSGRQPQTYESVDQAVAFARRQTWVRPGSDQERRLQDVIAGSLQQRAGRYAFTWEPAPVAVVTWAP